MNEMLSRDEQAAPTLRSEQVRMTCQALSDEPAEGAPSPRRRARSAPAIAVVEAARVAWPVTPAVILSGARERPTTILSGARERPTTILSGARERPTTMVPGSLLSSVARDVATSLLEAAFSAARARAWWS